MFAIMHFDHSCFCFNWIMHRYYGTTYFFHEFAKYGKVCCYLVFIITKVKWTTVKCTYTKLPRLQSTCFSECMSTHLDLCYQTINIFATQLTSTNSRLISIKTCQPHQSCLTKQYAKSCFVACHFVRENWTCTLISSTTFFLTRGFNLAQAFRSTLALHSHKLLIWSFGYDSSIRLNNRGQLQHYS